MKLSAALVAALVLGTASRMASADPPVSQPQPPPLAPPPSAAPQPSATPPLVVMSEAAAPRPRPVGRMDDFGVGFGLQRLQDDFGLSVLLRTPTFFHHTVRFSLAGGVAWYPHAVDASTGLDTWDTYGQGRLVVEGGRHIPGTPVRLYGFGGVVLLLPPSSLDSQSVVPGGIGGFGFEFNFAEASEPEGLVSYFIELGGVGTGATADKLPGHPIFSNGFAVATGLHFNM